MSKREHKKRVAKRNARIEQVKNSSRNGFKMMARMLPLYASIHSQSPYNNPMETNEDFLQEETTTDSVPGMWKCDFQAWHLAGQQCDCDNE